MKPSHVVAGLSSLGLALLASNALAWGPVGHQTVAYIAEDNLTPAAKAKVDAILGQDLDLAAVANWADDVRTSDNAGWHFIDIEDRAPVTKADEPKYCKTQSCVVDQVNADIKLLKGKTAPALKRFEALKFLVHFVGDLHQPLHCADDHDRGGNDKLVLFRKPGSHAKAAKIKLHALWDRLIEVNTSEDPRELADDLEQRISVEHKASWIQGTPADWAWESYSLAHDSIYSEFSPGPTSAQGVPLPDDYYGPKMRGIVDGQLEKAGIRLAQILNDIFGK